MVSIRYIFYIIFTILIHPTTAHKLPPVAATNPHESKIALPRNLCYNSSVQTLLNIKKVSLVLFLLLTGAHITAALLVSKGYDNTTLMLMYRTLDLPAILAGILYGASSVKEYLEALRKDTKVFDLVGGVLGGIMLIVALYLNFLF